MLGGGFDPSQMEQMMEQLGIDMEELNAEEVVIRTDAGDLVFADAEVTKLDAEGQTVFQVIGEPDEEPTDSSDTDGGDVDEDSESPDEEEGIPTEDVELVAQRAGVSEEDAREAIEEEDGDLAAAVTRLG